MLSGTNAFEISNYQEAETEGPLTSGDQYVKTLHCVENRSRNFCVSQAIFSGLFPTTTIATVIKSGIDCLFEFRKKCVRTAGAARSAHAISRHTTHQMVSTPQRYLRCGFCCERRSRRQTEGWKSGWRSGGAGADAGKRAQGASPKITSTEPPEIRKNRPATQIRRAVRISA